MLSLPQSNYNPPDDDPVIQIEFFQVLQGNESSFDEKVQKFIDDITSKDNGLILIEYHKFHLNYSLPNRMLYVHWRSDQYLEKDLSQGNFKSFLKQKDVNGKKYHKPEYSIVSTVIKAKNKQEYEKLSPEVTQIEFFQTQNPDNFDQKVKQFVDDIITKDNGLISIEYHKFNRNQSTSFINGANRMIYAEWESNQDLQTNLQTRGDFQKFLQELSYEHKQQFRIISREWYRTLNQNRETQKPITQTLYFDVPEDYKQVFDQQVQKLIDNLMNSQKNDFISIEYSKFIPQPNATWANSKIEIRYVKDKSFEDIENYLHQDDFKDFFDLLEIWKNKLNKQVYKSTFSTKSQRVIYKKFSQSKPQNTGGKLFSKIYEFLKKPLSLEALMVLACITGISLALIALSLKK